MYDAWLFIYGNCVNIFPIKRYRVCSILSVIQRIFRIYYGLSMIYRLFMNLLLFYKNMCEWTMFQIIILIIWIIWCCPVWFNNFFQLWYL